jgi:hypothetical protein
LLVHSYIVAAEEKPDPEQLTLFSETEPVYFSADTITYDRDTGIVSGEGAVEIIQDGNELRGDKGVINTARKLAEMQGHVVATGRGATIEGTSGIYDFAAQEGVFYNARGYSEPWYISAEEIRREPGGGYEVDNASMTTCSGPKPHYALRAKKVTVVPEERLTARNIGLFLGPVPIFYFPYYSQNFGSRVPPIQVDAGTQTDLGGFVGMAYEFEPTAGLSLEPQIRAYTKSGLGGGLSGRLSLFEGEGRGWFDTFYIYDLNTDNTDEPGIDKNRGTANLYYRQDLVEQWQAIVRAEYNSDSEFLKTFSFDKYEDREPPKSYFNVERTGLHSVVSFLTRVRLADYVEEVERLPQLRLELLEQRIGDTGFFLSAGNQTAHLVREPEDIDTTRNFSEVRLAYPLRPWKPLEVIPFIEGDATYYSDTLEEETDEFRLSGSPGLIAQTRMQRIYNSPFPLYTSFRHLIVPTVTYRFRPTPDERPSELLQFDEIDRIDRENSVEVEVRNYLQAKRPDGLTRQLVQYILTAGLDFDSGQDKLAELENELWITPVPNWELALKSFNDFRDESRNDLLSAVIRYTKPDSFKAYAGVIHEDTLLVPYDTQLVYSVSKSFGPMWRAGFEQRYDLAMSEFSYHEFWVWHSLDCLEALLTIRDRSEATSVMVLVNITAFPMGRIKRKIAIEPFKENQPWPTYW